MTPRQAIEGIEVVMVAGGMLVGCWKESTGAVWRRTQNTQTMWCWCSYREARDGIGGAEPNGPGWQVSL